MAGQRPRRILIRSSLHYALFVLEDEAVQDGAPPTTRRRTSAVPIHPFSRAVAHVVMARAVEEQIG